MKEKGEQPAEAVDVDELVDRRRVEAIEDQRSTVREFMTQLGRARSLGKVSEEAANREIARAVRNYIHELEHLLASTSAGERYWEETPIGTLTVAPPSPAIMAWNHKKRNSIGNIRSIDSRQELPPDYSLINESEFEGRKYEIEGLKDFINTKNLDSITHTARFHVQFHGEIEVSQEVEPIVPRRISTSAYRICNRFVGEIGLDIQAVANPHGAV